MLFNSLEFALFLPLAFIAFWLLFQKNTGHRNLFLIFISYIFYGWWDWRFLLLIIASSFVDFFISQRLSQEKEKRKRKLLVYSSLFFNLGILGVFKYYNFFIENFVEAFRIFGSEIQASSLNIILPVGISFYTFQTLSYTIDVYKGKLEATKDWKAFFAFVCFFPQLVAGPIERASNLLPQFYDKVKFSNKEATDGVRQILWGMFKKVVIADNCAIGVNHIFQNSADYSGGMLLLGGVLFAFQIYGDFSGYSDIAIGTARLFGFELKQNFAFPYFSRNIAEFWRRWHISLSTWFRDYLYIPLGGSRGGNSKRIQNTFIIFLVSGFWHGANWTFIFWGFLNALYFLPLMLANKNRNYLDVAAANSYLPSVRELMQITFTFFITTLAWVFFRADSITHAFEYLGSLFTGLFSFSTYEVAFAYALENLGAYTLFCILFLLIVEWAQRRKQHGLDLSFSKEWRVGRWGLYFTVVVSILLFGSFESSDFIYFQF